MAEEKILGQRLPKADGLERVTGKAAYGADVSLPGMLHGKILRSPHPHAYIRRIDYSAARKLHGVVAVVTAGDLAQRASAAGEPAAIHASGGVYDPGHEAEGAVKP